MNAKDGKWILAVWYSLQRSYCLEVVMDKNPLSLLRKLLMLRVRELRDSGY